MTPINVTIDFSNSPTNPGTVPDPSDGENHAVVMPVIITSDAHVGPDPSDPLIRVTEEDTILQFSFANAPDGWTPQFTGFRYYNTGDYWDDGWWTPGEPGAKEFPEMGGGGDTMWVKDRRHNETLYIFVVEWNYTSGGPAQGGFFVCDPKIKNESSGDVLSKPSDVSPKVKG